MIYVKPIKLYFAGAWHGKIEDENHIYKQIKNKLVSYLYPDQLETWFEVSKGRKGSIIIDSGAFSAWSQGCEVDLGAYIEYCHEMIHRGKQEGKEVHVVNLDVIPGKKGLSQTLNSIKSSRNISMIEEAAEKGFQNLIKMTKAGLKPIHVFHQGEDWKWLHKMTEYTDYIGISPANDLSTKSRKAWMRSVFEYMVKHNIEVDTHGFAVWMPAVLKTLPFTSCDAVTWRVAAGWGQIYYPVGGFSNPDYSKSPHILVVSERRASKGLEELTKKKLEMLERDGYSYDELQTWQGRCNVNIRYFLEFEKWLNEYRKNIEFSVQNTLF